MRKTIVILMTLSVALLASRDANACYYGLSDPDVETFCTGDALQAEQALGRITKRGRGALPAIERYLSRALRNHQHNVEYLSRLYQADPELKLSEEQRHKRIERIRAHLEWNERRIQKLDWLIIKIRGNDFGGEPWRFKLRVVG